MTGRRSKKGLGGVSMRGVGVSKGRKWIVEPATFTARRGRLTAVIGPSGCGKSTLLRAMVSAQSSLAVSGDGVWRSDGSAQLGGLRKGDAGFLTQESELFAMLSVRETLEFAYRMRGESCKTSRALAKKALDHFGLGELAERRVGDAGGKGSISGGERRRLCVALELARCAEDALDLLACDEPTSGLDSVAAENVIRTLHAFSRSKNVSVVASLHQPSSRLWINSIDDVIVLQRGGRLVYSGPVSEAVAFFEKKYKATLPPLTNPAEWFLDLVTADKRQKLAIAPPTRQRPQISTRSKSKVKKSKRSRAALLKRVGLLITRSCRQVYRDVRTQLLRGVASLGLACFLADKYGGNEDGSTEAAAVADRVALLTFSATATAMLPLMRALDLFAREGPVIGRERERDLYAGGEYVLAKALAELPSDMLFAAAHGLLLEKCCSGNLHSKPALPLALLAAASGTLGLAVGAATPSSQAALALGAPLVVIDLLTGIVNPGGVSSPAKRPGPLAAISPIRHGVVSLLQREFAGRSLFFREEGNRKKTLVGFAGFARDGDDVLNRLGLGLGQGLRPMRALGILTGTHLVISAVCLSRLPSLLARLGRAVVRPLNRAPPAAAAAAAAVAPVVTQSVKKGGADDDDHGDWTEEEEDAKLPAESKY